jgi:hypothetical protein
MAEREHRLILYFAVSITIIIIIIIIFQRSHIGHCTHT